MVKVTSQVLEGIEYVRDSGETNMFDAKAVQKIASDEGYYQAVLWIEENKHAYIRGIIKGFEIDALTSLAEEG